MTVPTKTPVTVPDPDRAVGVRYAWALVARREVMVKATDKAFLIGTVLTVAVIIGLVVVQAVLSSRTTDYDLAVAPSAVTMATQVQQAAPGMDAEVSIVVRPMADDAAARAAVLAETADAALQFENGTWVLNTRSEPEPDLEAVVAQVVRDTTLRANAAAAGTSVETLTAGTTLRTALLEGDTDRATLVMVVTFAFTMLFYLATLLFGVTLANSVLEEKQSRIVEIIATAIPVRQLLAGKILGNTLLALVQLTVYLAIGLIGLAFTDFGDLVPTLSGPVIWFVVFFLAGFVALACLWAVAGSLASRSEDLQSTSAPLTMVVMAVFFGGMFLEGSARTIGSFVPPLSAVLMPIRLLRQEAAWWEAALALGLLAVTAAVTVRIGERLYRRSLLQTGGQVSLRRAWSAED